jgi:hypothetical protein
MSIKNLFQGSEKKILLWISLSLGGGIGLIILQTYLVSDITHPIVQSLVSLLKDIGSSLIVASILLLILEIGLRKDFIEDIENIFKAGQPSGYIKTFHPKRQEFDADITTDLLQSRSGDTIDIIGISQRIVFSERPGIETLHNTIKEGCNLRILLLHPASQMLPCIENLSKDYGFPNLKLSLQETLEGRVAQLVHQLEEDLKEIKGSLEIRMYKDFFSSISYYSSKRMTLIGIYFSHISGTLCPAFQIINSEFLETAKGHFDKIWKSSQGSVIVKINNKTCQNCIKAIFSGQP